MTQEPRDRDLTSGTTRLEDFSRQSQFTEQIFAEVFSCDGQQARTVIGSCFSLRPSTGEGGLLFSLTCCGKQTGMLPASSTAAEVQDDADCARRAAAEAAVRCHCLAAVLLLMMCIQGPARTRPRGDREGCN